jgi:hypothetical protein
MLKFLPVSVVLMMGLTACNPFEDKIIGLCEDAVKVTLFFPSSYVRSESSVSAAAIPLEEYKAMIVAKGEGPYPTYSKELVKYYLSRIDQDSPQILAGNLPSPTRFTIDLKYLADAGETGRASCEYISAVETSEKATKYNVDLVAKFP